MVLKFLEKSCAYVFDKNEFNFDYEVPPAFDSGRPSNILNEDDFDYAIELQEHDEYRDVAAKTSHIADFTEENIQQASEASMKKQQNMFRQSSGSIATFASDTIKQPRQEGGDTKHDSESGESTEEGSDGSGYETDSSEEETDDEFDSTANRRSIFRHLKENSFNKRMFLLNKRKRWVENHARRYLSPYSMPAIALMLRSPAVPSPHLTVDV